MQRGLRNLENRVAGIERAIEPRTEIEDLLFADIQVYGRAAIEEEAQKSGFADVHERLVGILAKEEDTPISHEALEVIRNFLHNRRRKEL